VVLDMKKLVLAALAASALIPAAAQAQTVEPGSFGGFRVEGNIGWDKQQSFGNNNEKLGYGGSAGWDGNVNERIVIGPEVNYWHPDKGRSTVVSDNGLAARTGGDIWGGAVRVGVRATPDLLVFAKGGYANQYQRTTVRTATGLVTSTDHVGGYQVGGGFQFAPNDKFSFVPANVYLSAQYVYSRFDNRSKDQHAMAGIGFRFR
jgi:outer membrane immunogenic protein